MKLLSLFSGIGAFEKALDRLQIPYELVGYCEIDKYASKSYAAIHGVDESMNIGDITKVDEKELPKDIDLITYGFPCQDISLAGKQKGLFNEDGSQTRSGLFFEALRIIEETHPRVAIAENVKNLTSKKFNEQFQIVLDSLEAAGYNNYWKVLNAKEHGIPQNRERVFIVSIRKDIDTGCFEFPEGYPLELRLKDLLEDEADVDEKYYLSEAMFDYCMGVGQKDSKFPRKERFLANINRANQDVAVCISTSSGNRPVDNFIKIKNGEVTDEPLTEETEIGFFKVKEATKKGYAEAYDGDSINLEYPNSKTRRGRVGHQVAQTLTTSCNQAVAVAMRGRYADYDTIQNDSFSGVIEPNVLTPKRTEYGKQIRKAYEAGEVHESRHNMTQLVPRTDGIANTLTTVQKDNYLMTPTMRIRKLTPKECFRLQGFDDADFRRAESVCSNTQLIKQAGNSIAVNCPFYIIKALFDANILIEKEIKEMELKVSEYQLPEVISFNFEELKAELAEKVGIYETMVYTDDQIKVAKADKANLNKLKKALNDERIRREKEYMIPFNAFKAQVNEIIAIIDKPVAVIDQRVKEYEEIQKQKKLDEITAYFNCTEHPEWLHFSQIFDEKWLNASVSMKSVQDAIEDRLDRIEIDLTTLHDLPEFGFEATEVYKTTLDINRALNEGHRMAEVAKAKAEQERAKAEAEAAAASAEVPNGFMNQPMVAEVEDVPKSWVRFQALMTIDQARELKKFFDDRHIEFKAV